MLIALPEGEEESDTRADGTADPEYATAQSNGLTRSRQVRDVLTAAVWLAIATGLAEAAYWLITQYLLHELICMHPGYWWMSPLFQIGLMGLPAIVFVTVACLRPQCDVVPFGVTIFAFMGWLNLLTLAAPLHDIALMLAACGLAAASGRVFVKYRPSCLAIMRLTALPALVLLVIAAAGQTVVGQRREAAAIAALPAPPAGAPNILLIVLDAVRADALQTYGADREVAPHFAALAEQGVTFDEAWSTAPWTLPSQAGMFTGRLPSELSADWLSALDDSPATLAQALAARGWLTGGFVGNTHYCSAETGLARGFSHYEDYRLTLADFALCTAVGRKFLLSSLAVDCGQSDWPARKRAPEVSGGLLDWLPQRGNRPYFAFLNFYDAHDPYVALPGYQTRGPASRDDVLLMRHWWWVAKDKLSNEQVELLRGCYEDCIRGLDAHVGQMLEELKRRDALDNTIIIVTADHGEHFGGHNLYLHGNSLYEPLIHVPLVVVWPEKIPAGVRVRTPVSLSGLPNTLLELTGADCRFPGRSWAQCWNAGQESAAGGVSDAEVIAAEIPSQAEHPPCHGHSPVAHGAMQCLRSGDLKYIHNGDGTIELYDLGRDPLERHNLADTPGYRSSLLRLDFHWQRRYLSGTSGGGGQPTSCAPKPGMNP
jgi:arylsulfatase A-like enzyme